MEDTSCSSAFTARLTSSRLQCPLNPALPQLGFHPSHVSPAVLCTVNPLVSTSSQPGVEALFDLYFAWVRSKQHTACTQSTNQPRKSSKRYNASGGVTHRAPGASLEQESEALGRARCPLGHPAHLEVGTFLAQRLHTAHRSLQGQRVLGMPV